jgi:hypothetical protein
MPEEPDTKPPVASDTLDRVNEIASAHAPYLYFDNAPTFGCNNGIVSITLEAFRFLPSGGGVARDRVAVAHLRSNIQAAMALRAALDQALLLSAPTPSPKIN